MSAETDQSRRILQALWQAQGSPDVALDEECSPTKVCRNMQGISFEGYGEEGTDPRTAWRQQLAREGKLNSDAPTLGQTIMSKDQ
ncbi:MAG: hypothetical protein WD576_00295 [Nitriliruptoraceae bacterium]